MYTIKGYKKNLTQEHRSFLNNLFTRAYESGDAFEEYLLSIIKLLVARNHQDKLINQADFSFIMVLLNDFDDEYKAWLVGNAEPSKRPFTKINDNQLLSHAKNRDSLEILFDEIFSYFEHDVYKPCDILLKTIEEYEEHGTIKTLETADYIYTVI